jgi:hypothetical protein
VATRVAPEGFDVIIDDASHIGELTKTTFWYLFDHHLKPGELYALEKWGTRYCDDFPMAKNSIRSRRLSILSPVTLTAWLVCERTGG